MKTHHLGLILLGIGATAYVLGNKKPQTDKEKHLQEAGFVTVLLGAVIVMAASRNKIAA
jgi:hypothetical protein